MSENRDKKDFDTWIQNEAPSRQRPPFMVEAIIHIADGIEGAMLAAKARFGKDAKPEHALKILEMAIVERERLDEEYVAGLKKSRKLARASKNKS